MPTLPRGSRFAAMAASVLMASALAAQIISIPLGGPKKERPSPNAWLLGAPVDIPGAVAERGRSAAMRARDDTRHPAEVLAYLGLSRGERVLVVETDPGYYGEIIGTAVGASGRVVELVQPAAMADPATQAVLSDAIGLAPNLTLLAATPATARLTAGSFDFVLLDDAADQRAVTAAFLVKLFAAVRPGGIVGLTGGNDAAAIERVSRAAGFILDRAGHLRGSALDENTMSIQQYHKPE